MNERIKEIIIETLGKEGVVDSRAFGHWAMSDEQMEKFAELIVRECGYYADVFEAVGCPIDMDPTETKPSDYIKKHFGVEE